MAQQTDSGMQEKDTHCAINFTLGSEILSAKLFYLIRWIFKTH